MNTKLLYNKNLNLDFTGNSTTNPYALIQLGGKSNKTLKKINIKEKLEKLKKSYLGKNNINIYYKMRTKKQIYKGRLKNSMCRGKSYTQCRIKNGCKMTRKSASIKSYCRNIKTRSA